MVGATQISLFKNKPKHLSVDWACWMFVMLDVFHFFISL
jgi:hypothetical protein